MMLTGGWTTSPDVTMLVGFHGLWCGIARVKSRIPTRRKSSLKNLVTINTLLLLHP